MVALLENLRDGTVSSFFSAYSNEFPHQVFTLFQKKVYGVRNISVAHLSPVSAYLDILGRQTRTGKTYNFSRPSVFFCPARRTGHAAQVSFCTAFSTIGRGLFFGLSFALSLHICSKGRERPENMVVFRSLFWGKEAR
jgi:hypothetical protein